MDDVHDMILSWHPRTRRIASSGRMPVSTCVELAHARWLIIEQAQTTLPTAFLAMLIFWLTVLFASLGLLAPRNATTWCGFSSARCRWLGRSI